MIQAPTIEYYTQTDVARLLNWSRQRVWLALHTMSIPCVRTLGDSPAVLVAAKDVDRLVASQAPRGPKVAKRGLPGPAKAKKGHLTV